MAADGLRHLYRAHPGRLDKTPTTENPPQTRASKSLDKQRAVPIALPLQSRGHGGKADECRPDAGPDEASRRGRGTSVPHRVECAQHGV